MGFRVNKRIRIAKGISLNVGKKGVSVSAKVGNTTINSRGRVTTRIAPGVSYSTNLKSDQRSNKRVSNNNTITSVNNIINSPTENFSNNKSRTKKKSTSIVLCCLGFLGIGGIHKFYEGKSLMGIIYLLTGGLFVIGTIIDLFALLSKPSTYYI